MTAKRRGPGIAVSPSSMAWFNGWDITSQLKCDAASAASSIRSSPRSAKCWNVFVIAAIARFGPLS
jgi:hypothetical protein